MPARRAPKYRPIVILPSEVAEFLTLNSYQRAIQKTDRMPAEGLDAPILGLFGEVGSLLSALKKKHRDKAAFDKYDAVILEELGDVLWYLSNLAARTGLSLSVLAQRMFRVLDDWDEVQVDEFGTFSDLQSFIHQTIHADQFAASLITLAGKVGDLANDYGSKKIASNRDILSAHLVEILRALTAACDAAGVTLEDAASNNLQKIFSRWPVEHVYPPPVDSEMLEDERLPRQFEIFVKEHTIKKKTYVIQKRNGIIIGDRLTDNKIEKDDYRFHDVFHFSYAVFLGWSPVLRALFRLKRKSHPQTDENEDGARAILIEEGISTFIFERGLQRNLFRDMESVDYDLLKSIRDFVRGYEVERCALWQWEKAIIEGFKVFRELKKHRGGYVVADLDAHTLAFRSEK